MLNRGAIFTRTGPLNTSTTIGLASRRTNIQRNASTLARNKFVKSNLLGVPSRSPYDTQNRILVPRILFKCINTTFARSHCLRKIHTHLLARSSASTTDVTTKPEIRHISKNEEEEMPNEQPVPKKHQLKLGDIEAKYPQPRCKVNEIYQSVNSQLKRETSIVEFRQQKKGFQKIWTCDYKLSWPENITISATTNSKPGSSRSAALKVLQYLHNTEKLKNGLPVIYNSKEVSEMFKKSANLTMNPETVDYVKELLETYNAEIESIIANSSYTHSVQDVLFSNVEFEDPVGRSTDFEWQPENLQRRNRELLKRLEYRQLREKKELPISEYQQRIVEAVENSRALLIKGDTGCGKTTQVPQFIIDSLTSKGRATDCNMIVSQPRRISAVSLAERIAAERNEHVGDVVGYHVRLQQSLPKTPGGMLFCTTGILLRKMQSNPSLKGCSHVILDEAHERSINTDMLLVLLKRALDKNPDLKVVIMSATINADLFQKYFNCDVVEVPGRTYPVKMNFLEDITKLGILPTKHYVGNSEFPEAPFVDCHMIAELISWISAKQPPGAILCFLPGWAEITKVKRFLEEHNRHERDMIVPVHSRMPHYDQKKIFQRPPSGARKIVLATDIAETGITVTDVVYVVDSATRKAMRWHEKKGLATMENQYASQANILQRKGRAGRVQPGVSYHLVSQAQFANLAVHPLPEVLTNSLEKTVLDCKTHSDEKVITFLESMPQPPTTSAVRKALFDLSELGALDSNENLTPLGKRIALFSAHPKLSKAMVYSSIFQCVAPMITIASAMSTDSEIFNGTLLEKEAIRKVKQKYHPSSDHIAIGWLYEQWAVYAKKGWEQMKRFCWKERLYPERMSTLSKVRDLNADYLVQCRMLRDFNDYADPDSPENEFSTLDELVRGVLLAGLDQLLQRRDFEIRKGKLKQGTNVFLMENGFRATITQESVNFKRITFPSPFLTYVRKQHNEERRTSLIRETSMISPVTALLFSQAQIHGFEREVSGNNNQNTEIVFTIRGRKNFRLACDPMLANTLMQFRDSMWNVVRYLVQYQGLVENSEETDYHKVENYKKRMLRVLGKMLSEAVTEIDEPEQSESRAVTNARNKDDEEYDEDSDEEY